MDTFEKITVSVLVNAPVSHSWRAFTSPASIVRWNFASGDWCCPTAINDPVKGGTFSYRMESKDGKVGFDFYGTYTKVLAEDRLEYLLGDGRTVSVEFRDRAGKTEIVETFDAETENPLELQKQCWQAILDNFKKHVEHGG
jgi:uncharacterized protein YndB with AHSA1/START domain